MAVRVILLFAAAVPAAVGSKPDLVRYFSALPRLAAHAPPPPPPPPAARGMRVTLASSGAAVNDSFAWSAWAMAEPAWSRAEAASFALGGSGNFARVDWGGIADYACQGALIAEKLLCMGGGAERAEVQSWLLTMPVSAAGQAWEAQNGQWHVGVQGAWESSSEALITLRHAAAHGAIVPQLFARAPERLVCASRDGGATFAPAGSGASQPGLPADACAAAPAALLAAHPLSGAGAGACAAGLELFADTPAAPHPGPNAERDNGGRLLAQALALPDGATTHVSLALLPRASGATAWPTAISLVDVASGAVVAAAALPAGGAPRNAWSVLDVRDGQGRAPPAGLYLLVLTAGAGDGPGARPQDSWFLGASWASNACPATSGGASAATYGLSPLWNRNATADPSHPRLASSTIATSDAAVALEVRRLRAAAAAGGGDSGFGVSLAQQATLLLSHTLALSSQTPTSAAGGYDVFVIPDLYFRGSLEDGVNSGCSYYDLLRIGFASSYIALRALEAVEAYGELQDAGALPGTCAQGQEDGFGIDNAHVLAAGSAALCYSRADTARAADILRVAIGTRFSNARGAFVDWFGCALMGTTDGDVSQCRLQDVANASCGAAPPGSPLTQVSTSFLPTLALASKLNVPACGVDAGATHASFARARDAARAGRMYGAGWFHNALSGLEDNPGGARSLIVQADWHLQDAEGFAEHDVNETGDWQMFAPSFIAGGGARGYGQFEGQAENGGRFFSTTAFVFEGAPLYPDLLADWLRAINDITAVGAQIEANDTSSPLLAGDPTFLSTPVSDAVVFELCANVRKQDGFKNTTDAWGKFLCSYYQDLPFALPEHGVVLWSAAKAFVGLHVAATGALTVNGVSLSGAPPWRADGALPAGWPADATRVEVFGVAAASASGAVNIVCDADQGAVTLNCSISLDAGRAKRDRDAR
jgi:hypothetical protein